MKAVGRNPWLLILLVAVGGIIGGIIGDIFRESIKILGYGKTIGFSPVTIDLSILKLTLGFVLSLNLASVIGIILAILIFSKL
ncbi:hypothetical protein HNQ80_000989 [Anaerosolibacter carboniphilus]|uniref:DUF4321 domain-containing protein n=1 Tax=Anaerosolibacter carboniphilus TaxID=1417629 RepID=A0A841KM72_9FIRM|nr:DUF4321 domain-containing protein [Anaerosolibacter carboniphilus]MBB6214904.1 hypothetical protein [Anaerosolibacter carboniphilus]